MTASKGGPEASEQVSELWEALDLTAIETEEFQLFLDHIPIAIVVARTTRGAEQLIYANQAFETLTGLMAATVVGKGWPTLDSFTTEGEPHLTFSEALAGGDEFIGTFRREQPVPTVVEVYSGTIDNDDADKSYHIVALIDVTEREKAQRERLNQRLRDKDLLLKELQHRVKNNLQLITALIRLEARNERSGDKINLERLTGRIEALHLLYRNLEADGFGKVVDLGHYLSQIASAVMRTYAIEGIRLDLKVDHMLAPINVAMPIGLLVNELLTNAFKYAFNGREGGIITVRCLQEGDCCRVVVADDGIGLPDGGTWPVPGKLGALILQSLRENVKTDVDVESARAKGVRVTLAFPYIAPSHTRN